MYNQELRPQKKVILCEDGTNTLFSSEFNEPYHSTKDGALHESLEKHVKPALMIKKDKSSLVILDICFGLGYNSLATLYYVKKHNIKTKIEILSPEFDDQLIASLMTFDYPDEFKNLTPIIQKLSQNFYYEDAQFKIDILRGDARVTLPKIKKKIDIVYQDAFSPTQNPLLWTKEFFQDISHISKEDTILTTYSTAASIRLGLYENAFYIYIHYGEKSRYSTIASRTKLDLFEYVDMELKKVRNPIAQSFRDKDFICKIKN